MKKNKWTKWILGSFGMLGMIALFQEIQTSPVFSAAVDKEKTGGGEASASAAQPNSGGQVERPNVSDQAQGDGYANRMQRPRRHRGEAFGSAGGGGSTGTAPNSPGADFGSGFGSNQGSGSGQGFDSSQGSGSGQSSGSGSGSFGMNSPQTAQPQARTTRS